MRKTYIHFTERQYACLEEDAHRFRISVSEIVLRLVEEHYRLPHETV